MELLAGALIGDKFSFEAWESDAKDGGPPNGGEFLLAIDPGHLGDGNGWAAHAELLFERILAEEGTRLPAGRRHANRENTATEGAAIPAALHAEIVELCG